MGALSLPQVAATLAAALVAFETKNAAGVRLIDEPVINTVIVLMVVTSVLGPVLTERFCKQLMPANVPPELQQLVPSRESMQPRTRGMIQRNPKATKGPAGGADAAAKQ